MAIIPPLPAASALEWVSPTNPMALATFTTRPQPWSAIVGAARA
jgi:hypothetical protein